MRYLHVSCILAIMMVLIRQQIISTADPVEVKIAPSTMSLAFPPPPPPPPPPPWDDDDIACKTHTLESMPRFPGCENTWNTIEEKNECSRIKLLEYIRANLQYPLLAKQHGIQGRSVVQFIIETDGTISTIQCVRRPGYGIDEEAVRELGKFMSTKTHTMRRTFCFFTLLIGISSGTLSQILTSFDSGKYEREIRSILQKFDKPGVNKVNVAWEFANYHNTMVKEYPDHAGSILEMTSAVAKEYELDYVLEGNTIVSAQLPPATKPTQSSGADKSADETDTIRSIEIFKVLEQMPRFPGCEDHEGTNEEKYRCAQVKMLEYVYSNIRYPYKAAKKEIEGRAVVQFIVEIDGTLTNIACVRGLGYGIDEEVVRVVETMNHMPEKWIPGKQRGKPVRVQYTLPVAFKL